MAIEEIRIDDRLIHGQVCSYWIPYFKVERIVVVDDKIVADEQRKTMLRFGCPDGVKVTFWDAKKAAEKFSGGIGSDVRVMVLCASPIPLAEMANAGFKITHANLGNMSTKPGAFRITNNAFASIEELAAFRQLLDSGAKITSRMTPNDDADDLASTIDKLVDPR